MMNVIHNVSVYSKAGASKFFTRLLSVFVALLLVATAFAPSYAIAAPENENSSDVTVESPDGTNNGLTAPSSSGHSVTELPWYPSDPSTFEDFHCPEDMPRVVDNADLLSSSAEAALEVQLANMRRDLGVDFVFLSDVSSYGLSRAVYAADFVQFNGYGVGDDYSTVIFFVCMEPNNRGFWTAACGEAKNLLTEDNVQKMDDLIYDYFVDGNYETGILTQFNNLNVLYAEGSLPVDLSPAYGFALLAFVVAIIGGFRELLRKKAQMKTIETKETADSYISSGLKFSVNTDTFLGTTVERTIHIDEDTSDDDDDYDYTSTSSYSSSYSSSGGRSFSGGGRSF